MQHAAAMRMANNTRSIRFLVEGCEDLQLRWKPDARSWSLLEVLNHLSDEDAMDFRMRLDLTLHQPGVEWPQIDPPSWVTERRYNMLDTQDSLARYLQEREHSIAWLKHLQDPQWSNTYEHPKVGAITAGDLLTSWIAHDLLHIRQMTRLHFQWLQRSGSRTDYAGEWEPGS